MHAPLRGIFGPNSGYIAHYAPFIWPKSPTNCDAHLPESNFKTRSSTTAHIPKLVYVKPRYSAEIAVNFTQIPLQRVRIILNVRCSVRACLKIHSRHLHKGRLRCARPTSRYIWAKFRLHSPLCALHLAQISHKL